jgi:hypothetical protein
MIAAIYARKLGGRSGQPSESSCGMVASTLSLGSSPCAGRISIRDPLDPPAAMSFDRAITRAAPATFTSGEGSFHPERRFHDQQPLRTE